MSLFLNSPCAWRPGRKQQSSSTIFLPGRCERALAVWVSPPQLLPFCPQRAPLIRINSPRLNLMRPDMTRQGAGPEAFPSICLLQGKWYNGILERLPPGSTRKVRALGSSMVDLKFLLMRNEDFSHFSGSLRAHREESSRPTLAESHVTCSFLNPCGGSAERVHAAIGIGKRLAPSMADFRVRI